MTNNKVVTIRTSKLAEARVSGVYAAAFRFDKHKVVVERDGSTSEVPFSQTAFLLRMPGEHRSLWLTPSERVRVLEALQEVDPLGSLVQRRLTDADPGEATPRQAEGGEVA